MESDRPGCLACLTVCLTACLLPDCLAYLASPLASPPVYVRLALIEIESRMPKDPIRTATFGASVFV